MTWIFDLFKLGFPASIDFVASKTLYLNSVSFIESLNSVLLKYCLAYVDFYFQQFWRLSQSARQVQKKGRGGEE